MWTNWTTLKKLIWLKRSGACGTRDFFKTIRGTSPLTLVNAAKSKIKSLIQNGKCTVSGSDITCNNGTLSVVNGDIITTGTAEVITVSASGATDQTASAVNLYAVDGICDEQDIVTGKVIRRTQAVVSDGTTPSGRYIGTVGEGNVIVQALETLYKGSIISISADGGESLNLVKSEFSPVQDLHGYDNPWPEGGGVNILDPSKMTIYSNGYGRRWGYEDVEGITLKANQAYTFSVSGTTQLIALYIMDKVNATKLAQANASVTYTPTEDVVVYLQAYRGEVIQDANNFQLELGSTATSYSPYSNECPISGWTGVNINRAGKNLCEPTEAGYKNESGAWFNGTDITSVKNALNTLPVGEYTISFKFDVLTTVSGATSWGVLIHNTVSGYIDGRQNGQHNADETLSFSKTFSVTESNKGNFDHVYMYSGGGIHADVYWYDFQLELGSTATSYEPYSGTTYPIPLGQTVYGGTLDVTSGVLTVTQKSHVFDGTERWDLWNGVFVNYDLTDAKKSNVDSFTNKIIFADRFKSNGVTYRASCGDGNIIKVVGDNTQIACYSSAFADENAFKTFLTNNAMTVVYELATPITIQLTPQELTLLANENNIWSSTNGDITVAVAEDEVIEQVEPQKLYTALGTNTISVTAEVSPIELTTEYSYQSVGSAVVGSALVD